MLKGPGREGPPPTSLTLPPQCWWVQEGQAAGRDCAPVCSSQSLSAAAAARRTPGEMGDRWDPQDAPEGLTFPSQDEKFKVLLVGWLVLVLSSQRNFRHPP